VSRVVVLGSGISGHTAAAFARRRLGAEHSVTVVSPKDYYNWIPSNIWVGVGRMTPGEVTFPLRPVYDHHGIEFVHGWAREIHPEGDSVEATPYVAVDAVGDASEAKSEKVRYDFLINATGPQLRFDKTEGLGPEANSQSVCTADHAAQAAGAFGEMVERMRRGERKRFLVGVGHEIRGSGYPLLLLAPGGIAEVLERIEPRIIGQSSTPCSRSGQGRCGAPTRSSTARSQPPSGSACSAATSSSPSTETSSAPAERRSW